MPLTKVSCPRENTDKLELEHVEPTICVCQHSTEGKYIQTTTVLFINEVKRVKKIKKYEQHIVEP